MRALSPGSDVLIALQGTDGVDTALQISGRVLDAAPIGMVLTAPDGGVLWANAAMARLLGRDVSDLIGTSIYSAIPDEDMAAKEESVGALLNGSLDRYEREERWVGADGSLRWVSVSASLATAPDGSPLFVQGGRCLIRQVLDVTDRKNIELQLERSNEELTQFAYVASHDLSEPLRVVAGHVELLARRYQGRLDDDANRYIEFAVDGCSRMRCLIDDLLAYSRAGWGTTDESIDLSEVVGDVLGALGPGDRGAEIIVGALPVVQGSGGVYRQILANLIGNAVRFVVPGQRPRVVVDAERVSGAWCVRVSDNGIGVPAQYRERIFEIFQRLNQREDYPGTGIGLAVAKKLVTQRGGEIWVEDGADGGALFCFTIPDPRSGPA